MAKEKMKGKAKAKQVMVKPVKKVRKVQPMRRAAMPAKRVSKKVSPRTVRGKIASYQNTAAEFQSAARKMLQSGASNMQAGVRAIQSGIKQQIKNYKEGAIALQEGVAAMQSSIVEQIRENQEYVKNFYG